MIALQIRTDRQLLYKNLKIPDMIKFFKNQIIREQKIQLFNTFERVLKKEKEGSITDLYFSKIKDVTVSNDTFFTDLQATKNQKMTCKKAFGITIFIHCQLQKLQYAIDYPRLENFLSDFNIILLNLQIKLKCSKSSHIINKMTENQNDQLRLLKLTKSYLNYIINIMSSQGLYKKLKFYNVRICDQEYQVFKSSLNFIVQINKQIQTINRYYYKEYANYIKFAIQCLTSDTRSIYLKLEKFITKQNLELQHEILENYDTLADYLEHLNASKKYNSTQNISQMQIKVIFIKQLFDQLIDVNSQLFTLYQSRQFEKFRKYLQLPNWTSTSKDQYKFLEQLKLIFDKKRKCTLKKQKRGNIDIHGKTFISLFMKFEQNDKKIRHLNTADSLSGMSNMLI